MHQGKMDWSSLGFCFCLFAVLTVSRSYIAAETLTTVCPSMCVCSGNSTISCQDISVEAWLDTCKDINQIVSGENDVTNLHLENLLSNGTFSFECIPPVRSLDVSSTRLEVLTSAFKNLQVFHTLSLSQNEIQILPDDIFSALGTIVSLNLSLNSISALGRKTFSGLYSLQSLDLSFNNLSVIQSSSFEILTNLTYLNLRHNRIEHFTSWHLPPSSNLQVLILKENALKSFYIGDNESDAKSLDHIQSLDISYNPLECTCILQRVLHKIYGQRGIIEDMEHTLCNSPSVLKNLSVVHLNETALMCSNPHSLISFPSNTKSVLYRATITLECRAEAFPSPHIMWVTPWGDKFSLAPLPLIVHKGLATENEIDDFKEYEEKTIMMTSSVRVTQKNELVITHFRGNMVGNFSCVAFNEIGNRQEVIYLSIRSMIKSTYQTSLKFASYCASVCLFLGFFVGLVLIVIRKVTHKVFFNVPLFTPAASVRPVEEDCCASSIYTDLPPPTSPLLECQSETCTSDKSTLYYYDCEGMEGSPDKRPHHLLDSIEGARERLRDGVGRKVESMKRNVLSIKESTGAYVQNIMESGSSAANKMKAGVVLGVETVKYHVQSVKELCGTGNMGIHTISIISMETDIDTNERKSVVRQVTFV